MCLVCVVLLVRCRKMYCFAPGVRFKSSSSNIDRWIREYACLCLLEILAYSTSNKTSANMEMRCFTPGARTQPATEITTFAVLENAYITPVARTQPATAITTFAVLENAYFTPGARTQPATAITTCVVLVNVVWCL